MIDAPAIHLPAYEPPALVKLGSIVDIAAELEKYGAKLMPQADYQPGDPVDWSHGRVS